MTQFEITKTMAEHGAQIKGLNERMDRFEKGIFHRLDSIDRRQEEHGRLTNEKLLDISNSIAVFQDNKKTNKDWTAIGASIVAVFVSVLTYLRG